MARLKCTGLTANDAAICGSAVAMTVPSRFSMKRAQATVSAMTADLSRLSMAMVYCLAGAIVRATMDERKFPGTLSIAIEAPDQPDVLPLLAESEAYHAALYPGESLHILDVVALRAPGVSFFVARID